MINHKLGSFECLSSVRDVILNFQIINGTIVPTISLKRV